MKVALVGTSIALTEQEEKDMTQFISIVLKRYDINNTIIISGGAKGVDTLAIEIATSMGFKTEVDRYKPDTNHWEDQNGKKGYKSRNLLIAKECDELHSFSVPYHKLKCYHHEELEEHERTAACWTLLKVKEMDKPCQLIVMPPDESINYKELRKYED